jgi:hypothetical protein
MAFVVEGNREDVDGVPSTSWMEDPTHVPRLGLGQDARQRSTRWVRGIVLHTTKGIPGGRDHRPQLILPGLGPSIGAAEAVARSWSRDPRQAGAHLVVDHDGTVVCVADLVLDRAFHAGTVNDCTIGVEIFQGSRAELYEQQLAQVVRLVDWLTVRFGIQRQIPKRYMGPITRLMAGGRDVVGVYGHRDVTDRRGSGDPGDAIFDRLRAAGYETWDLERAEDKEVWRKRQGALCGGPAGRLDIDGIAGYQTVRALQATGRTGGMWVARPGDSDVRRSSAWAALTQSGSRQSTTPVPA